MDSLYNWIVFLHIAGAFTFALAHGVSAAVALKLRQERDVPRVQALLDLSNVATQGTYVGLVILLIGDAWDAMTSDRPYRKALGHDAACAELRRCRGTQWDPRIVDAFIELVSERAHAPARANTTVVTSPA